MGVRSVPRRDLAALGYRLGLLGLLRKKPSAPCLPTASPKWSTSRHSRTAMLEPDLRTYSQITLVSSTLAGGGGAGGATGVASGATPAVETAGALLVGP